MSENVEKSTLEQYEEIVQELGLEIKSKFVPFSISINANEEHKTLNWKVTIKSSKNSITIDFNKVLVIYLILQHNMLMVIKEE